MKVFYKFFYKIVLYYGTEAKSLDSLYTKPIGPATCSTYTKQGGICKYLGKNRAQSLLSCRFMYINVISLYSYLQKGVTALKKQNTAPTDTAKQTHSNGCTSEVLGSQTNQTYPQTPKAVQQRQNDERQLTFFDLML